MLSDIRQLLTEKIWEEDLRKLRGLRRFTLQSLRLVVVLVRDFYEGQLTLRAMSLVYTTLLSLVPLIAFSFSLLKGLGVHNRIEPLLFKFLEPLGPKGAEIGQNIMHFVENVKAGVLGSIGLALLLYTVISLVQKVENGFNYIWRVTEPRSLAERFSDYLSVIVVGPLLVVSAMGITASVSNHSLVQHVLSIEPLGHLYVFAAKLTPYALVISAFTFFYYFVPNTKVKIRAALFGGITAGVLWETAGWLFATFTASSTRYTAIYSGFAILIVFMLWLYLSWLILLFGAQISFYWQHPELITRDRARLRITGRLRERLGLLLMYLVGERFVRNAQPWTLDELAEHVHMPGQHLGDILHLLEAQGLLVATAGDPRGYVPGYDLDEIHVRDIVKAVRHHDHGSELADRHLHSEAVVDEAVAGIENAIESELGTRTLKDLVTTPAKVYEVPV